MPDTANLSATQRRTRKIIRESFVRLLSAKEFSQITVRDVCELADINRATFYRYYSDLYALREDLSLELLDALRRTSDETGLPEDGSTPDDIPLLFQNALRVFEERRDFSRILLKNGDPESFLNRLSNTAFSMMRNLTGKQYAQQPSEVIMRFLSGGMIYVLSSWISADPAAQSRLLSSQELGRIMGRLCKVCFDEMGQYKIDRSENEEKGESHGLDSAKAAANPRRR